ncbi:prepilin-type N-terminal cleavage/methylation domain-containing protein [Patescibacteria group bacterium]
MIAKKGYTLIELVVVTGIVGVIGVVSVGLFLSTLRGGGKTTGLNDIRGNGDYAITQIERMLRSAIRIEGTCSDDMTSISLLNPDGNITVFSTVSGRIASNSGYLTSSEVDLASDVDFDCQKLDSGTPATVSVTFELFKAATSGVAGGGESVEFSTAVQLRTY